MRARDVWGNFVLPLNFTVNLKLLKRKVSKNTKRRVALRSKNLKDG